MRYPIAIVIILCLFACDNTTDKGVSLKTQSVIEEPIPITIYLKELDVYFTPDSCRGKINIDTYGKANGKLYIDLISCKGRMNVKHVDNKGNLLAEGQYEESLDTLKKYRVGQSAVVDTSRISVLQYFQPLPEGVWKYHKEGKIDTIVYHNGLEVKAR